MALTRLQTCCTADSVALMATWHGVCGNGTLLKPGRAAHDGPEPRYTLICRSPSVVRSMLPGRDPLRMAEAYLTTCALEFESGEIGLYQVLASKRVAGATSLPLTRRHLYS